MVLEYKFEYVSNNNNYVSFLNNILKDKDLAFHIAREDDTISLYIEAEEEMLLEVSNELSEKLPMSIFLKNYTLEAVPQVPEKDYIKDTDFINLPYCSNCVANIDNEYSTNLRNPFIKCDICGATCDVSALKFFENGSQKEFDTSKALLEEVAKKISEDKRVRVKTKYYDYVFYKLNKLSSDNQNILATNIENISNIAVSSQEKKSALLCVERPAVQFNINEIYKRNHALTFEKVNISLARDLIAYLLSKELTKLNIDFVAYEDSKEFDCELVLQAEEQTSSKFEIAMHNDRTFILENDFCDKKLHSIYENFEESAISQFMVLVEENKLYEKSILNLYCSSNHHEQVTLFSEKIDGMINILSYKNPLSISEIFNEINKSESGKRLLENYKNKFPENFKKCLDHQELNLCKNSISSLWEMLALVLGFEEPILESAKKALLQKGPRVDYKLIDSEKSFNRELNITRLVQSGMSFKLAGVDNRSLSLGYVESYAYFLADIVDTVNTEFELDGVALCGDLVADEFIYKMLKKAITNNFKLFYNKDFPIQL